MEKSDHLVSVQTKHFNTLNLVSTGIWLTTYFHLGEEMYIQIHEDR